MRYEYKRTCVQCGQSKETRSFKVGKYKEEGFRDMCGTCYTDPVLSNEKAREKTFEYHEEDTYVLIEEQTTRYRISLRDAGTGTKLVELGVQSDLHKALELAEQCIRRNSRGGGIRFLYKTSYVPSKDGVEDREEARV